jgi:hypothetical protein
VAVGLALAVSSATSADTPHKLLVLHGKTLAWTFHTAACAATKHRFTALVPGGVKHSPYALAVVINGYDGPGSYPIDFGPRQYEAKVYLDLYGPGNTHYSNTFIPPFPSPGYGHVYFMSKGALMGLAFGPAMYNQAASDAVSLTGVVSCSYRKRR